MQSFSVWAPYAQNVELVIAGSSYPMQHGPLWTSHITPRPGMRYGYRVDGTLLPDPRSQSQPEGVHGLSEVVDLEYPWQHPWHGVTPSVIYELHIGAFGGSFDDVISRLPYLASLGVNAIEIMPVQPFAGDRNWGYDGVFWHAVHHSYGGPQALQKLVDAAHGHGIGVILDVVYNHFGPEGNYVNAFGPYTVATPTHWGEAINMTEPHVRNYILDAARQWFMDFRIDGLRLDATHAYTDLTLLTDLSQIARDISLTTGIPRTLIAEDLRERPEITTTYGMDFQWNDTIHHALHTLLSGERHAYYSGFGDTQTLLTALATYPGSVVYTTTHDQVGNRPRGDRPSQHLTPAQQVLKFAIISSIPQPIMLFMGEEYGATTPFPFFCSHTDPAIQEATRRGREALFQRMGLSEQPLDPTDPMTFTAARLNWQYNEPILAAYRTLLQLRAERPIQPISVSGGKSWLVIDGAQPLVANLSDQPITLPFGCQARYSFGTPNITDTSITLNGWEFVLCDQLYTSI